MNQLTPGVPIPIGGRITADDLIEDQTPRIVRVVAVDGRVLWDSNEARLAARSREQLYSAVLNGSEPDGTEREVDVLVRLSADPAGKREFMVDLDGTPWAVRAEERIERNLLHETTDWR